MSTNPNLVLISSRCAQTIHAQRRALAEAVRTDGWQVALAGDASPGDPYIARIEQLGFDFFALPVAQKSKNPFKVLALVLAYVSLLRRLRPQVFHAFTIKPVIAGLIAAKIVGTPVRLATIAGLGHVFLSSSAPVRWIASQLFRLALGCAHKVFFYNSADRDLFLQLGIVAADKTELIPGSGVDTTRFSPAAGAGEDQPFTVLFIGRLLKEKGVGELLEAAALLSERGVPVTIEMLGDIDENNPSSVPRSAVEDAQARGNVVWHGATDDVRPYMARVSAVVLPSYREGIPLSLLEAAAMGKPMIAADVPGCRDVVRHGETGLLVPVKDSESLAAAIAALVADPALARRMGAAARHDAETRFDAAIVTRQVLDTYRRVRA